MVLFTAKAFVLATGSIGKAWKHTSNPWESVGDGHAMAIWAGADVIDMECVQFHPTGMVWLLSVRGILVTEGVRGGDGGRLRNSEGERFMFNYVAPMFRAETAETEEEADAWYDDHINYRRTPDLLPLRRGGPAINPRVKAGAGHAGTARVYLDIASRWNARVHPAPPPVDVPPVHGAGRRRHHRWAHGGRPHLPLWHDGRRARDAETQAATVPGLFAIGEVSGGMHRKELPGREPRSDLIVFGRRAGIGAADFAEGRADSPSINPAEVASVIDDAFAPFGREDGYNPYTVHEELQEVMQTLVGIIRTGPELEEALARLEDLKQQTAKVQVKGGRAYNPGWNLADRPCPP